MFQVGLSQECLGKVVQEMIKLHNFNEGDDDDNVQARVDGFS